MKINVQSVMGQVKLRGYDRDMETSIQRMSTGNRINSSADDPYGISEANKMRHQVRSMEQAQRNGTEGNALLQIAEGGCEEITDILQRMRELAVQSSTDTLTSTERVYLQHEFSGLRQEVDRIAAGSSYNGISLLDGASGSFTSTGRPGVLQIGTYNQEYEDFLNVEIMPITVGSLGLADAELSTHEGAVTALDSLEAALASVNSERSKLGGLINHIDSAMENLALRKTDMEDFEGRIRDVDFAKESTAMATTQVLRQVSAAMIAQANAQPQSLLALLDS